MTRNVRPRSRRAPSTQAPLLLSDRYFPSGAAWANVTEVVSWTADTSAADDDGSLTNNGPFPDRVFVCIPCDAGCYTITFQFS